MSSTPQDPNTSQSDSDNANSTAGTQALNQDRESKRTGGKGVAVVFVLSIAIVIGLVYSASVAKREQKIQREVMEALAYQCARSLVGTDETHASVAGVLQEQEGEPGISGIVQVRYDMDDPIQVSVRVRQVSNEELSAFAHYRPIDTERLKPGRSFGSSHRHGGKATIVRGQSDGTWVAECELMPQ